VVTLFEDTAGKTRDLPIYAKLRSLLIEAADATGVERVRVTSGGQAKLGTPGKRTGSTRHDLGMAADLVLERGGRTLDFTRPGDLPVFEAFVRKATALGATGIGAGVTYMGPLAMHVGFGSEACWGAGGKSANAPDWLRRAVLAGRADRSGATPPVHPPTPTPGQPGRYVVIARSGLRMRSGPGSGFPAVTTLLRGTHLTASFGPDPDWAKVDLQDDGLADGFVFAGFLAPA
jgi:hypothetical protein